MKLKTVETIWAIILRTATTIALLMVMYIMKLVKVKGKMAEGTKQK